MFPSAARFPLAVALLVVCLLPACDDDGGVSADAGQDPGLPTDSGFQDATNEDPGRLDVLDPGRDPGTDDASDPGFDDPGEPPPDAGPDEAVEPFGVFQVRDLTDVGNVRAMWAAPGGTIWAVGDSGLVLRSDGGDFLPAPIPPADVDLHGVSGVGATVFVVGAAGTAWRLDVSGWTDLAPPTDVDLTAVDAIAEDDVFVVGREGTLLNFKDGVWHPQPTGITSDLYGVSASAVGGVHVVGAFGGLLQRQGSSWVRSQIAGPGVTLRAVWRAPDGKMVAVGSAGTVLLFDGISWKQQLTTETASPPRTLFAVTGLDGEDIVAVGDAGAVVQYDAGKWRMATVAGPFNVGADLRAVAAAARSDGSVRVIAGGLESASIARDDEGKWIDRVLGVTSDLYGVDVTPDGTAVAVGEGGLVLTIREGRVGTRPSGTEARLNAVSGRYAVGEAGTLLDLALDPVQGIATGTQVELTDVWADETGAWIVAADGSLFRLDPEGVRLEVRRGVPLTSVCAADAGRWAGGVDGRLEMHDSDGDRLLPTDSGSTLRDLIPVDAGVIAVGDHGLALHCGPSDCVRLFEDPASFLYGVHRRADRVVAAGWAGLVLVRDGDGPFDPLETGTFRVFRDVAANADGGVWTFVGLDGTFATWTPGDAP